MDNTEKHDRPEIPNHVRDFIASASSDQLTEIVKLVRETSMGESNANVERSALCGENGENSEQPSEVEMDLREETRSTQENSPHARIEDEQRKRANSTNQDTSERPEGVPSKASVTIKEINDNRYYYWQWREGDTIKSKYKGPVDSGL